MNSTRVALLAFFGMLLLVSVSAQYGDDSYNEVEDEDDYRDSRQAAYAYVPPSKSCARVSYGNTFCGGFSASDNGGCDSYCVQQGYPYSWCRPNHCLCHRGQDNGKECENVRG